jgi:hypothetical protein
LLRADLWAETEQVPLVKAIRLFVLFRAHHERWSCYEKLGPDPQSYALMEEFLFCVAVLHR